MAARFRPGDAVVYRMHKRSLRPNPRGSDVRAAQRGDYYSYVIAKFWRVVEIRADKTIVVRTRRGKQRTIDAADSNLRRAYWWERLWFRRRFPPRTPGSA